jgi:hypothetical protein|uniref:RING-type E3 ubiquitin transferase n=1 Tax=viral metagenome TaxID=1070528 RepID=A0A6C0AM39_9ZZZZ
MDLPQQPGLNRRLAYSDIIRNRNRNTINNNTINRNFNDMVSGNNIYQFYKKGLYLNDLFQKSSILLKNNFDCSICQEDNDNDNDNNIHIIRKLNCNHQFHIYCIEKWLSKETTCPICRKNLSNL